MYAIIRSGGKQYTVKPGDILRVEKLEKDLGSEFDITDILFIGGEKAFVGDPLVAQAKVSAVVVQQDRGQKVLVFKKKRRKGYRRMKGHRQLFTALFIKAISAPNGETIVAENKPFVLDPAKKAERLAMEAAQQSEAGATPKPKAAKKPAKVKKVASKKAGAKKPAKKAGKAKKKTAAKKTKKSSKK